MALQRRERERLAREAEILSAAERLFITKGYENTTMDVIAKEAEFTKRTLYQQGEPILRGDHQWSQSAAVLY